MKITSIFLFLFLFATIHPLTAQLHRWEKKEVDNLWLIAKNKNRSAAVFGIYEGEEILYEKAVGKFSVSKKPIKTNSVFYLGNFSEVFIAISILQLEAAQKLNLDDSVKKYFPYLPEKFQAITIRHLLNHTSGIAHLGFFKPMIEDPTKIPALFSQKGSTYFQAGEKQIYSTANYWFLAQLVKIVSGESLKDFAEKRIFQPLQMEQTQFSSSWEIPNTESECFLYNKFPYNIGQEKLFSSLKDIRKFSVAFFEKNLLPDALKKKLLESTTLNNGQKTHTGLAYIETLNINNQKAIKFSFLHSSPFCSLLYLPKKKVCFIHVAALQHEYLEKIGNTMSMLYGDDWLTELSKDYSGINYIEQVEMYNGHYLNAENGETKNIDFQFGYVYSWNRKFIRADKTTGLQLKVAFSKPAKAISTNQFILWQENTELEFDKDSLGYKFYEFKFGIYNATYRKTKRLSYDPEKLLQFVGNYKSNDIYFDEIEIFLKDNKLYWQTPSRSYPSFLRLILEDQFRSAFSKVEFFRDQFNDVKGFKFISDSGNKFEYQKIP